MPVYASAGSQNGVFLLGLRVKSSNYLHTELNLGYLKGTKFCLESEASFIDISYIASFKPVLIAWLREYCTFSDSSVVNLKSSPWPKYTHLGTVFQKKSCSTIKLFFLLKYVLSKYLVLIGLIFTEIEAFKNKKNLQRNVWKCGQIRTFVRICPHFHTFLCNFFLFLNASISVKISPINTKLGDFVNLGVLFLTMWINSC